MQGDVHRSWVHAESLLSPVFDGLSEDQKHLTLLQQVSHSCDKYGCQYALDCIIIKHIPMLSIMCLWVGAR